MLCVIGQTTRRKKLSNIHKVQITDRLQLLQNCFSRCPLEVDRYISLANWALVSICISFTTPWAPFWFETIKENKIKHTQKKKALHLE